MCMVGTDTHRLSAMLIHGNQTQNVRKYFSVITQDSGGASEPNDAIAPPADMRSPAHIRGSTVRAYLHPCSIDVRSNRRSETANHMPNAARKRQSDRFPTPPKSGRYSVSP